MPPKTNALGLEREAYKGGKSTLCPGCGHDSISNQIISIAYDLGIEQSNVIKLSGIGCSSKTPAYFLGGSHSFNSVHGRMPSVATGATLANRSLTAIGVSGDGDSGSIGLGQFKHLMRRNVPMIYIVENNGVYGLTKGQFSATSDAGQVLKYYGKNELPALDLPLEAIIAGCTFCGA
jgi:2-oxoglutarate ferredoxin oxidoreductase subunit beta